MKIETYHEHLIKKKQQWTIAYRIETNYVATLALARDQGKGVVRLRAYK
jgi:hypothetical protein